MINFNDPFNNSQHKDFIAWLQAPCPPDRLFRIEYAAGEPGALLHYEITILRETPQMWWIDHWSCKPGKLKGVLKGDGKRFAHETKHWAMYSFIKRNTWYQSRLRTSLAYAEDAGKLAANAWQNRMALSPGK